MRLSHLLGPHPIPGPGSADPDPEVAGVTADSRQVTPGVVFFAVPGARADGLAFAARAAAAGAPAVVGEGDRPADLPASVAYVRVPDVRRALSLAAASAHPGQPGTVLAVVVDGLRGR